MYRESAHRYEVVRVTEPVHRGGASHEADQGTVHRPGEAEVLDQFAVQAGAEETGGGNDDELGDVRDIEAGLLDGAAGNVGNEGHRLLLELVQSGVHGHLRKTTKKRNKKYDGKIRRGIPYIDDTACCIS